MSCRIHRMLTALIAVFLSTAVWAEALDVPIMERASSGLDSCGLAEIAGLKAGGDGFLAVRSGPGTDFSEIDRLHNGDKVWAFETRGDWYGVLYGVTSVDCGPVEADRPLSHKGKAGWIYRNWVSGVAG